ncbi:hypothetical protein BKP45_07345 [Anaerobacillus alkalidiazotrophicus]|uniref:HD-GYP domain-containing protein n=1 Tax=Anaerobacillus alkalidiazotrophicus TaxID=472963 RepID=A0A1S2M8C9_9BACI|nr:HD domain-containing phosphohydrolase [Anaerobacillus alkalidiazotrophicus]OIJ20999.1 hypothetical protein BKP45_07345 [Anaerobacillus alkalidiazotrophicus]
MINIEKLSFRLVGKKLEEDVFSNLDVLLLKKGTILTEIHITLLQNHHCQQVKVSDEVSFQFLYQKNIEHIEQLFLEIENLQEININDWFEPDKAVVREIQKNASILDNLYERKTQPSLFRHSANVGLLAFFLGKLLRYSYTNKLLLWKMGVLHDIGKRRLPSELWTKQEEELTEAEKKQYRKHPELGFEMLKKVSGVNAQMLHAAKHHHERIDGSGYPNSVRVKHLPMMVQIISVANQLDKILTTGRTNFELVNQLVEETRENKYNPAIVIPFVGHLLRKYVGKQVVLNDGTKAEVAFIFDHEPSHPLLYLKETDTFIDLRNDHKRKIVELA